MNIEINPILWTCKFTNNWANGNGGMVTYVLK